MCTRGIVVVLVLLAPACGLRRSSTSTRDTKIFIQKFTEKTKCYALFLLAFHTAISD